jgi:hypothetical protein
MGSSVSGMESKCEGRQAQCRVVNGIGIPRQRCGFLNLFTPWIQRAIMDQSKRHHWHTLFDCL